MRKLYLIGVGLGTEDLVTPLAVKIVADCDLVYATERVGRLFAKTVCMPLNEIYAAVSASTQAKIGVLVSGDAGFYSMSRQLCERFKTSFKIEIINGISSLQYFSARLGLAYDDIAVCSLHGRNLALLGKVSYNRRLFALTGGVYNVKNICSELLARGLGNVRVTVGENLGYETERITCGTAAQLSERVFGELAVILIENPQAADRWRGFSDSDFIRGSAPMTKEHIRNWVVAKLAIRPNDIVYDIGAGTGSVAVVLAHRAYDGLVYAIEHDPEAVTLIEANRSQHHSFNLMVIPQAAPAALAALPAPDAVFIGGSSNNLAAIVQSVKTKNPAVRIVVTAVTLETLTAISQLEDFAANIVCVNAAQARAVGRYRLLSAENPIYIAANG